MYNIQPGQGLGFTGSKEIALGLGSPFITEVVEVIRKEVIRLVSTITRILNLESDI